MPKKAMLATRNTSGLMSSIKFMPSRPKATIRNSQAILPRQPYFQLNIGGINVVIRFIDFFHFVNQNDAAWGSFLFLLDNPVRNNQINKDFSALQNLFSAKVSIIFEFS